MSDGIMIQPLFPMVLGDETEEADVSTIRLHVAEIYEDLRLAQRVEWELRTTGCLPLLEIKVSASGRVVSLEGRVPNYHLKHLAEITVLSVTGVEELRNDLEVIIGKPDIPQVRNCTS